ncbi:hypothetical protein B0H34DRAFT_765950 [Crassisporium funariophilum]|nr:hypothetical protein B0H34DRAFT_765950 [Crassisporium funariophilum]
MELSYQTTVLGKRKASRHQENLVLHLTTPTTSQDEHSDMEPSGSKPSTSKGPPVIINGLLVYDTKRRYCCTYQGCEKAYIKPSRLEEHERSHTGQRPFVCDNCNKSYLRETHLHAHARSHQPEAMRPFKCERVDCEKRFWTSQHLKVHHSWHDGIKPYKCTKTGCNDAFAKHHQLRAHICAAHAPPGTKPFICEQVGCTKSFDTNQHLKTHQRTHNSNRYTCVHLDCLASANGVPAFFHTWSALQSHIRTAHPPACFHQLCIGRTFTTQANLRAHMKLHEQHEVEATLEVAADPDPDDEEPSRKRRRGGDIGRDWECKVAGCEKDFKSKKALATHTNVTHLGMRDFICQHIDCGRTFGYKHLLQRHLAKYHAPELSGSESSDDSSSSEEAHDSRIPVSSIDAITGQAYAERADNILKSAKGLCCPFPHLQALQGEQPPDDSINSPNTGATQTCTYVFSRAYDLRRHLASFHDVVVRKISVDEWVSRQKRIMRL